MAKPLLPIILAGGKGQRLWPLSCEAQPKQFLSLVGDNTLLQNVLLRLRDVKNCLPPIVVCQEQHRFLVAEQILNLDLKVSGIILEPEAKDTAPAITLAALYAQQHYPDANMIVLPSDHVLTDNQAFISAVEAAAKLVDDEHLLFLATQPSYPETAYGYIKLGRALTGEQLGAHRINEFVEKPDLASAQRYLESGNYVWNSGIFYCRPQTYLQLQQRYVPDVLASCSDAMFRVQQDTDFIRPDKRALQDCPKCSIQYLFAHNQHNQAVVMPNLGWSDIGSWDILANAHPADEQGNVVQGNVLATDVNNSYIRAEHRLLAVLGVSDHIIVETGDAVLVAHKSQSQELKKLVEKMKNRSQQDISAG